MKLTITEYASFKKLSTVTVYDHIKKGKVEKIKEGLSSFIILTKDEIEEYNSINREVLNKDIVNTDKLLTYKNKELKKANKSLTKQLIKANSTIDSLYKDIKSLNKQLNKEQESSINLLKQYISEVKVIAHHTSDDEVIITDTKMKKSKKKRK